MIDACFPPAARLRQSSEFRAVFAHGQRFVRSGLVVIIAPGAHYSARLGLALAKRRISRSVDRNRVKRVVRESFRHRRDDLGAVDVVVLARNRTAGMTNRKLAGQLQSIWSESLRRGGQGDKAHDKSGRTA